MIKANELRIGNWVISAQTAKHYQVSGSDISYAEHKRVMFIPIPITPEILEMAGFNVENKPLFKYHDFVLVRWSDHGYILKEFTTIENLQQKQIEYVHQLQNLYFALTGEELEMELK